MPAATAVSKEQMRMLVLAVGCTEAARQTGVPLNTVLSWSSRGKWLKPVEQILPATVQSRAIVAISPADALANTLAEGAKTTRIGLTKYAARMASQAADSGQLEEAPLYKAVADIHGKMHPEQQASQAPVINIALLGLSLPGADVPAPTVIDLE